MITEERMYLNTFLIWGARQYDPANTDHIKSVNKMHSRVMVGHRILPKKPTSRHLSHFASNYQT